MAESSAKKQSKKSKRPVIVRRPLKVVRALPTGTWKITYADFVTALMAFFLLMWLTTTVSVEDLKLISKYFQTPLTFKYLGARFKELQFGSVEKGGGSDMLRSSGNTRGAPDAVIDANPDAAKQQMRQREIERLRELQARLEEAIDANPGFGKYKNQIRINLTSDGLRILIFDDQNRPMFEIGKSAPQPYTAEILRAIGSILNQVPNRISLSGHTDAMPYQGGEANYSNWELSTDRANASRRELIAGGMAPGKILRVVGLASSVLQDPAEPFNPVNRRINIIVMNPEAAEEAVR